MIHRRFPWFMTGSLLILFHLFAAGLALSQEVPKQKPSPADKSSPAAQAGPGEALQDDAKRKAAIDQLIADYDLTPHPLTTIPDNPPPHEGAMISLPYVVEPPDLVIVEVLEALPGRPISGERLVKPDGTITLGFYGEVPVRGLTLTQIQVAIIKQLRKFMDDEALGLAIMDDVTAEGPTIERPAMPPLPQNAKPFDLEEVPKQIKKTSRTTRSSPRSGIANTRSALARFPGRAVPVRPVAVRKTTQAPAEQPVPPKAPAQIQIPVGGTGRITITVDVVGPPHPEGGLILAVPEAVGTEPSAPMTKELWRIVRPEASDRVFVDVSGYNTKNYYVLGDVLVTGRLPWTGNETVLDALQYAGGLVATADPKNIHLVRPARGGKPARVYKIDYEAILVKGDVTANYQIFPGDRLIIGRNDVVQKTVELDRLAAPIQTVVGSMLQEAFTLRAIQTASPDHADELYTELLDFWLKQLSRRGDLTFDEQTLRDALLQKRKLTPPAAVQPPK